MEMSRSGIFSLDLDTWHCIESKMQNVLTAVSVRPHGPNGHMASDPSLNQKSNIESDESYVLVHLHRVLQKHLRSSFVNMFLLLTFYKQKFLVYKQKFVEHILFRT